MTGSDFVFVPFYELDSVPDASVDFIFNTDSMQEMNPEIIEGYFRQIRRVTPTCSGGATNSLTRMTR